MRTICFALVVLLTVISLEKVAAQSERRVEGALVQGYARAMISAPPTELGLDTFYKKYADAFVHSFCFGSFIRRPDLGK